eukprot:gene50171-61398_t
MGAMALITAANVVTRYLSNISLAFTEEYSVALMVVVAMVGTALATAGGRHIRIGFFADKLSPNRRRIAEIMALGLLILCFGLILWYGARMVWDEYDFEVLSPGLGHPQWLYTVWLPVLAVLGGLVIWQQGGRYITSENAYVRADIVQIAPEVTGRVVEVLVRDHARVEVGTVLLRIDPEPFRLAVEKAEAELDAARTLVEVARATYRETQSELGELQARADHLLRQARRQQDLAARGVSPATRLEETQNDADVARERINVVRQRLVRLLTTLKGDPDLPVDEHPNVRE